MQVEQANGKLSLVWKAEKPLRVKQFVCVQLLDESQNKNYEQLVKISPREECSDTGEVWRQTIDLPPKQLTKARQIGLIVTNLEQKQLPLTGSLIDQNGMRLVVPLESESLSSVSRREAAL